MNPILAQFAAALAKYTRRAIVSGDVVPGRQGIRAAYAMRLSKAV